jgi:hypothetical protein
MSVRTTARPAFELTVCWAILAVTLSACMGSGGSGPQIDAAKSFAGGRNYATDLKVCQDKAGAGETKESAAAKVGIGTVLGAGLGLAMGGDTTTTALTTGVGVLGGASSAGLLGENTTDRSLIALKSRDDIVRTCLRARGYKLIETPPKAS